MRLLPHLATNLVGIHSIFLSHDAAFVISSFGIEVAIKMSRILVNAVSQASTNGDWNIYCDILCWHVSLTTPTLLFA